MNKEFNTNARSNYFWKIKVSDRFRQGSLFRDVFSYLFQVIFPFMMEFIVPRNLVSWKHFILILNIEFTLLITLISINMSNEYILADLWNVWIGWELVRLHGVDRSHIQDKNEVYPNWLLFYFINITLITMKQVFLRTCTKQRISEAQSTRGNKGNKFFLTMKSRSFSEEWSWSRNDLEVDSV